MNYISPPADLPPGSVVDAYLRDSGGEGQDRSVESQFTEVQAYFKKQSWIMGEVYKDSRSGKSASKRAGFEKMLKDYETGRRKPQGLCLWDYARFARNTREAVLYIASIENQGIIVHSLTDNIPDGEYKDLLRLVKHMGNQAEREKNSAAVKRELHQLLENNGAMFGTPPRGFVREPLPPTHNARTNETRIHHKWVPDPSLAPLVLRAFEMKAQGATTAEIMQATGLYKSSGCLTTFFANKLYKGVLAFGDKVIENYCDPIVPPALWDEVNAKRRTHAPKPGAGTRDPKRMRSTFLLSGLLTCQQCGGAYSSTQIKGWKYYACTTRRASKGTECDARHIPKEAIETAIIEAIKDRALDLETLVNLQAAITVELDKDSEDHKARRVILNRDLLAARKEITNLTKAIGAHGHSEALLASLTLAETRKIELDQQLEQLENTINIPRKTSAQLKEIAATINTILTEGTDQQKQHIIRTFTARIIARRAEHEITALLYYLPVKIINPDGRELLAKGKVPPRGFEPRS
jgi:site-specific DNA recombinase